MTTKLTQTLVMIIFLCTCYTASAFEIKGKLQIKDGYGNYYNGHTVYLFKNSENAIHKRWSGETIIDSCIVENQSFHFSIPNTKNGTTYRIQLKESFLYYFFNKDKDMEICIRDKNKGYKVYSTNKNTSELDSIFQKFVADVNVKYFNPYLKREAINYLKENMDNDAGMYLAALYSSHIPDRFCRTTFFTYPQLNEVVKCIPDTQEFHPLYKNILVNLAKLKSSYKKPEGFRISGYVDNLYSSYAILVMPKTGTCSELVPVDTVPIKNGYFEFTGKVDYPKYGLISVKDASFHKEILIENSDIEVNLFAAKDGGNFKNYWMVDKVWGVNFYSHVNGSKSLEEYKYFRDSISCKDYSTIGNWIKDHPKSHPALLTVATSLCAKTNDKISKKWLSYFDKSLHSDPAYKYALKAIETKKRTSDGAGAPIFTLPDVNGKMHSLKDFKGKYVLIDFWASWCGPCKGEVPYLKDAFNKYKDKGLVVIGISSDKKREAWLKAIEHEGMNWLQLNSNGSDVSAKYGVSGIPHIVLIDKKGNIIASKLRGNAILGEIENAMK